MKLYFPKETGKILRMSPQKVRNLCQSGELKASNFGTDLKPRWRISQASIDAYLDSKSPTKKAAASSDKRQKLKGVIEFF